MSESLYVLLVGLARCWRSAWPEAPSAGRRRGPRGGRRPGGADAQEALLLLALLLVPLLGARRPARRAGGRRRVRGRARALDRAQLERVRPACGDLHEPGSAIGGANCRETFYGDQLGGWQPQCLARPRARQRGRAHGAAAARGRRLRPRPRGPRCPSCWPCAWPACGTSTTPCRCPRGGRCARRSSASRCTSLLVPFAIAGAVLLRRRRTSLAPAGARAARERHGARDLRQPALPGARRGDRRGARGDRRRALRRVLAARSRAPGGRVLSFAARLAVVVALGVAVRVAHTLLVAPWPPRSSTTRPTTTRWPSSSRAARASSGRPSSSPTACGCPTAERAPLFPLALAGLAELGITDGDARLLGLLTGGGTIAVLGLLGRRLAGDRAGLLAAGLAALYPTLIAADGALMTESLYGLLAACGAAGGIPAGGRAGAGRALVLGAVVGLAALVRAEALLLLPLLLVPLVRRPGGVRAAPSSAWPSRWCWRPGRCATGRPSTARCSSRPRAARPWPAPTASRSTTATGSGAWSVLCAEFSGRGNEAVELNERAARGSSTRCDHVGRLPSWRPRGWPRSWGSTARSTCPRAGSRGSRRRRGVVLAAAARSPRTASCCVLHRRAAGLDHLRAPFITVTLTSAAGLRACASGTPPSSALVVLAAVAARSALAPAERRRARAPTL